MAAILTTIGVVAGIVIALLIAGRVVRRRLPEDYAELVAQLVPVLILGTIVVGILIVIDPDQAELLLESAIRSVPRIMVAIIVVIVARGLGRVVGALAETALRRVSPVVASRTRLLLSSVILGVGVIIALQQVGISTNIILILVAALAFGVALSVALAFGNGSELMARQVAAGRHVQNTYAEGEHVRLGVVEGTVVKIGMASTRLDVGNGEAIDIPNEEFLKASVAVRRARPRA